MMRMFRTRYRILVDDYAGYQVEFRRWWMPLYKQISGVNTRPTEELALALIKGHKYCKYVD